MLVGVDGGWDINRTSWDGLCLLRGAVSRRDVHHPHASWQLILRRQPHCSMFSHLRHLLPRLLSSGRDWRQSQPWDNDTSRSRRVLVDGRWDHATNPRCHSYTRWVFPEFSVVVFSKFRSCCNICINKLFGYHGGDSTSVTLVDLCLPSADTVVHIHNSCFWATCVLYLVIRLYCGWELTMGHVYDPCDPWYTTHHSLITCTWISSNLKQNLLAQD